MGAKMLLSAALIHQRLLRDVALTCRGVLQNDVLYGRPEFATLGTSEFLSGHLYVGTSDNLPRYPTLSRGVMLVCVGGNPPAAFLSNRCACLVVSDRTDIFTVFNALTAIFNEFDAWDEELIRASDVAGDMRELLALGEQKLDNPMLLLDEDLYYLAYSSQFDEDEQLAAFLPDENGYADVSEVAVPELQRQYDMVSRELVHMHTPYELFSSNLFVGDEYQGSLTLACVNRPFDESDGFILSHFARRIEDSMRRNPILRFSKDDAIKSIVHNLVRSYPVEAGDWARLEKAPHEEWFVCAKVQLRSESRKIPADYICNAFERGVHGCIAFPHAGSIVTVVNGSTEWVNSGDVIFDLLRIAESVDVVMGLGTFFKDLSQTRAYYRQASIALDYGLERGGDEGLYLFDRFAVDYMVEHCSGEFSNEMLYRRGLDRLVEHDKTAQSEYVRTLRTYLDNNMRVSETARALFIHRTSLMARLKHIEKIISADLDNPDDRLQLMINLRAMERD